jgi:hypothetical protein
VDALLPQSLNDGFGSGVQAEAEEGGSDCSFLAGGAHVAILTSGRPSCLLLSLLLCKAGLTLPAG